MEEFPELGRSNTLGSPLMLISWQLQLETEIIDQVKRVKSITPDIITLDKLRHLWNSTQDPGRIETWLGGQPSIMVSGVSINY